MAFKPTALNERTLKQFVDRLLGLRQKQPLPTTDAWPPKRHHIQEEIAAVLGFPSWYAAITAVKSETSVPGSVDSQTVKLGGDTHAKGGLPLWPDEPARNTYEDYNKIIAWAAEHGASDIVITTGKEVTAEYMGRYSKITARSLSADEVEEMVKGLWGGVMPPHSDIDMAHQVKGSRAGSFHRFRVNATTFSGAGQKGWQITCKAVATMPPTLEDIGADALSNQLKNIKQGLVVVAGQTGSGKTTTISAIVRDALQNEANGGRIITYESPIEFVYDDIPTTSVIAQHTIGSDVASFPQGIRNAMRRGPSMIVVGECRDNETLREATVAANTGHLILMGTHAWGVADTISRLVRTYENKEGLEVADFIQSLALVTAQILVPTVDGKRVALRETLVFDEEVVEKLLDIASPDIKAAVNALLGNRGEGFLEDARKKFDDGVITQKTLQEIERAQRRSRG